jgi:cellulose synthase/poly-beta-1,6-N-acetylglucosamine synthase-like glycosyltransferase
MGLPADEKTTMPIHASLTMIAQNESARLGSCLASVRDLVDEIIVVDTGSTDNTKDIAAQHGARVFDFAWGDSVVVFFLLVMACLPRVGISLSERQTDALLR